MKKWQAWAPVALVLALIILMFHSLLTSGAILFASDVNIGSVSRMHAMVPGAFAGCWYDSLLAGHGDYLPFCLTYMLMALSPPAFFINWIHAFYLAGASFFLVLFLRRAGIGLPAALLGILAAFWVSSNFTLLYAGHTPKFGILFFAAMFLWIMGRLPASDRRVSGMIMAGGAMGMMIVEQADVGLFFALVLGPYALFVLFFKCHLRGWHFARLLAVLLVPAFLIALRPALEGYRVNIQDVAAVSDESPAAQWEFVTQWSWPPEESIDFIAPGYTGWRSGEPAGPYWGRMGRSAGWESTRQGFQNFKLENVYIGAIPVALALFAIVAVLAGLRKKSGMAPDWPPAGMAPEVLFWGVALVVTLLLAFGKNFPLYHLFYQLPFVGNIRNPNKFLQIFQLALAILAAYGLDVLSGIRKERLKVEG